MIANILAAAIALAPVAPAPAGQSATIAADEAAARRWIASGGHRFDPSTLSSADLQPLVARLKGTRVIGVGEATHGTHQDQAFKAELIKELVRAGAIDALAIECNRAAGYAFDRYVVSGEGDPAALIRSPSFFSIWRNDDFAGLLLWIRAWNQTAATPVHVYGIDVQDSGNDADFALSVLAHHAPAAAADLRARLAPILPAHGGRASSIFDWVRNVDAVTVARMLASATDLEAALTAAAPDRSPDRDLAEARYAARAARQGLLSFEHDYAGAKQDRLPQEYWGRRDREMARNLLDRIGTGRAAFWAQNGHVVAAVPEWEDKGYVTTGVMLRRTLAQDYQVVGFTWSRAVVRAVALPRKAPSPPEGKRVFSDSPARNDRPGDLGATFSPLPGDGYWIDMAARPRSPALDRWAARPTYWGVIGWRFDPTSFQVGTTPDQPPGKGYDIIVWHRTMSAARTWPRALPTH
ncbi:erythromycin esterase family protein [Sphingomonas humi]|uniref:Erythromycin esterase family protein n=1 Tax=Sphingomonas humi TaxID=335630 RepID=A0ABP7RL61_9SPHN